MERKIDKVAVFRDEEYLTCQEVITFLFEYLAGEISEERARDFERHLAICPSCVAYLESYRDTIRLGRESVRGIDERPAELAAELMRAILASRPPVA